MSSYNETLPDSITLATSGFARRGLSIYSTWFHLYSVIVPFLSPYPTINLYLMLVSINPLTPELNPCAQPGLTRFFTGDFAS
jgi:hypothetical protein